MRPHDGNDRPPGPGRHPTKLDYMGHVLMDHRQGLPVDVEVTEGNGYVERQAALTMVDRHPSQRQRTVSGDKAYDSADFVADCRTGNVTPHVAMNITDSRDSPLDAQLDAAGGRIPSNRSSRRS